MFRDTIKESQCHNQRRTVAKQFVSKIFDYSQACSYFVTICTHRKKKIFSSILNDKVILDPPGIAVRDAWFDLPQRFSVIALHDFVIMPNHFHGILRIVDAMPSRGAASSAPTVDRPKLGEIIRAFKSLSAIEINRILSRRGEAVWQRNYYEHIIRDEKDFQTVREYIRENPVCWNLDPENI